MAGSAPESTLKILGFAAGVALVCALLVSTTVHWVRPIQNAIASLDQTRAVLEAARMLDAGEQLPEREIIDRFLVFDRRIIDLQTNEFTDAVNPASYDYRNELTDQAGWHPRYMQSYVIYEDDSPVMMVLPFYGAGMWSTIHGYLALEADLATIAGVTFYEHGETPGIGDRIQGSEWLEQWRGKRLYDFDGQFRFRITAKAESNADTFKVDAITGATLTVSAVEKAVVEWFGNDGYGPLLAELREQQ